jgi:hypothetical protein
MQDLLPADPKARRLALAVWAAGAVAGTIAVWYLSSYLDTLSELGRTDREAALALFRSRVLPALAVVVLVAVVSGALLLRQGLQIYRTGEFPPSGAALIRTTPKRTGPAARAIGAVLAATGFLLAAVPLAILSLVLWMLRNA